MSALRFRSPRAAGALPVLLAVVLHAGLLGLGLIVSNERPLVARSSRRGEVRIWLELDEGLAPGAGRNEAPPSGPAARTEPAAALRAASVARVSPAPGRPAATSERPAATTERPASVATTERPPTQASVEGEAPSSAQPTPVEEYGGPPGPALAPGSALAGPPVWSLPGVLAPRPGAAPAPTAAPTARPVDPAIAGKVLASTLQTRDKQIGLQLPAAGVVASALNDAVRSSDAPGDARATFEVKLSGDGAVRGVRVVSSTAGKADAWERVASKAAAALAARTLTLGEAGKDGVTVKVVVTSKVVYPTHTKERGEVAPVCAEDILLQLADSLGQQVSDGKPPNLVQLKDGSFCIPIGIRISGDLSNIGAHLQRVVSSSYDVVLPNALGLQAGEVLPVDTRAPWLKNLQPRGPRLPPPREWQKKKKKKIKIDR